MSWWKVRKEQSEETKVAVDEAKAVRRELADVILRLRATTEALEDVLEEIMSDEGEE
jgi:hypothetical protein